MRSRLLVALALLLLPFSRPHVRNRKSLEIPGPARRRRHRDSPRRPAPSRAHRRARRRAQIATLRTTMLVDIEKLPTAENSAIHLHPTDNVAVARVPIPAGAELRIDGISLTARDAIPAGHKVSLRKIAPGEMLLRYGQAIGRAKISIEPGQHVHTHNLSFEELH